jgi:hypothetical protein
MLLKQAYPEKTADRKNNTTGGTRGAGTVYPSGAPDFNPFSVGFVLLDL